MNEEQTPADDGWYERREFRGLDLAGATLSGATFEACAFLACRFAEATFYRCSFNDCAFEDCDLSRAKLPNSRFVETRFRRCNAIGIDWTVAGDSAHTRLPLAIAFNECAISYSSFYGLTLRRTAITRCRAHEADFTEADLSWSDLRGTDFRGSAFARTNLGHADLREASNYAIDPTINVVRKARFSLPEAVALLRVFDIDVE